MKYNQYSYEYVKDIISEKGYQLISSDYNTCKDRLLCKDKEGYFVYTSFDKIVNKPDSKPRRFHISNDYSVYNINHWAELNGVETRCISSSYLGIKELHTFKCKCGKIFETIPNNFLRGSKNFCDTCTGYNTRLSFSEVRSNLKEKGYHLLISEESFKGVCLTNLICSDDFGYKYSVVYNSVMNKKRPQKMAPFHKSNIFSIDNINRYLQYRNCQFVCISDKYENDEQLLIFKCNRCGEIIQKQWQNVNRNDKIDSRFAVACPYCDGRTESLHALVLKQLFKHEYPDTIEEDKSYINPKTNKPMPTDIVNHRLKIAIEIQSQWHDFPDKQERDEAKRDYWYNKGYDFYAPDIRNYSILEMCQLFFDIDKIPEYVDFNYSNKLNIKQIQNLLDSDYTLPEIAKMLNVSLHRLHDAVSTKKIHYPENYIHPKWTPILQFDSEWNFIKEYPSYAEVERQTNIKASAIKQGFRKKRNYICGFNWTKKVDFINNKNALYSSSETAGFNQ